ncbi:MAG TPA: hypothetical protein VFW16_02450 [Streptosporangiaceae bacterium]|nr:hypothetical protein [Streptosporangiaceae bacterium]
MQAAVDAARAAHEQAEDTLVTGPSESPQVAESTQAADPRPQAPAPPAVTNGPVDASAPAAHWPEFPGNGGAVRQPSPSGTAFDPVTIPAAGRTVRGRVRQARGPRGPRVAVVAALAVILVAACAVAVVMAARGGRTGAPGQPETRQSHAPGGATGPPGGSAGTATAGLWPRAGSTGR